MPRSNSHFTSWRSRGFVVVLVAVACSPLAMVAWDDTRGMGALAGWSYVACVAVAIATSSRLDMSVDEDSLTIANGVRTHVVALREITSVRMEWWWGRPPFGRLPPALSVRTRRRSLTALCTAWLSISDYQRLDDLLGSLPAHVEVDLSLWRTNRGASGGQPPWEPRS